MTQLQKAHAKVRELIREAKRERDHVGYHENMGYEKRPALVHFLSTMSLSYSETSRVLQTFDNQCDNL